MKLILASQSLIRRRALDLLGLKYEVLPADIDEKAIQDPDPLLRAKKLSEEKAKTIGKQKQGLIIASDAFLMFNETCLEKPQDLLGGSCDARSTIRQ
ncbi:MAG: Maf family protein [Chlamydiales bacterium]|nr:Maf family protein [Chlamydiales bacterium]